MSEEEGVGKSPPPIPEQPSIPKASVVKEVVNPPNPTLRSREDNVPKILMFRSKGPVFRSKSADYNSICGSRVSSSGHVFRRTRSLNAPSPVQQFGPCGRIMKNSAMVMTIQDPASQRLVWYKAPLTVLVVKKVRDASVHHPFIQLVSWLIHEKRMVVTVEASVMQDPLLRQNPGFMAVKDKLTTFQEGEDDLTDRIDFIICLGGDGTLLYASSLFQQSVPPIMAFHLGSLGFLAPFEFDGFRAEVTKTLDGDVPLTLRSRLRCLVIKKSSLTGASPPPPAQLGTAPSTGATSSNAALPAKSHLVLNEVVIDRGPSPYLCNIDLFLDGKHITSVQGDGLIVSTPTGSTAYAVAAGASMIHPSVPAIMVTPICPHSLSFRPIVVPAGVELKVMLNPAARSTVWTSFDGRSQQEMHHGDSLRVTTSIYPVPSICAQDQIADWFESLAECLHWNLRQKQKSFDDFSDSGGCSLDDSVECYDRAESTDSGYPPDTSVTSITVKSEILEVTTAHIPAAAGSGRATSEISGQKSLVIDEEDEEDEGEG